MVQAGIMEGESVTPKTSKYRNSHSYFTLESTMLSIAVLKNFNNVGVILIFWKLSIKKA